MRKFLLTFLCLILISCSSGTTEESVSETQADQIEDFLDLRASETNGSFDFTPPGETSSSKFVC